jgi:hypothetical protein
MFAPTGLASQASGLDQLSTRSFEDQRSSIVLATICDLARLRATKSEVARKPPGREPVLVLTHGLYPMLFQPVTATPDLGHLSLSIERTVVSEPSASLTAFRIGFRTGHRLDLSQFVPRHLDGFDQPT